MFRTGLFVLLSAALAACSATPSASIPTESVPINSEPASLQPTAEPTPQPSAEPTPEPRAATEFIVVAEDVPNEFGELSGLELRGPNSSTEITEALLPEREGTDQAAKIIEEGFVSGYGATFGYGASDLYSSAYVFDNPEGALAYQADDVAVFLADRSCTDASDTVATIGDASSALRCPTIGPVEPTAWIIFVTDSAVLTVRIKAMTLKGETEPNLELLAEIASNLEARVAS